MIAHRRLWIALGASLTLVAWNAFVAVPVMLKRSGEKSVTLVAYRRWLIDPSTTVIDLWQIDGDASMADVDRNLFLAAEALNYTPASQVELAYRGSGRFLIPGERFHEIGSQWRSQNVAFLISAIPEAAMTMDGKPAFGTWTGGWLEVIGQQLNDHNQLHWSWYLASMTGARPGSPIPDGAGRFARP